MTNLSDSEVRERIAIQVAEDHYRDSFYGEYVTEHDRQHRFKLAERILDIIHEAGYRRIDLEKLEVEEIYPCLGCPESPDKQKMCGLRCKEGNKYALQESQLNLTKKQIREIS